MNRIPIRRSLQCLAPIFAILALTLPQVASVQASGPTIKIGARGFTEDQIAGYLYSDLLSAHGFNVSLNENFSGDACNILSPLTESQFDVEPDYLGNGLVDLGQFYKPGTSPKSVLKHVNAALKAKKYPGCQSPPPFGNARVELLTPAYKFNDQNVFVTSKKVSQKFALKTLSDLAKNAHKLSFEIRTECTDRTDCFKGFVQVYRPKKHCAVSGVHPDGCAFKKFDNANDLTDNVNPPFYGDVVAGKFDVVQGYGSTDAQIAHFHLVALKDNKSMFPPDQLVPFVRASIAKANPKLVTWLNKLSAAITTKSFLQMNAAAAFGGELPQNIAHNFLVKHHLI